MNIKWQTNAGSQFAAGKRFVLPNYFEEPHLREVNIQRSTMSAPARGTRRGSSRSLIADE